MEDIQNKQDGTYTDHANLFGGMGAVTADSYASYAAMDEMAATAAETSETLEAYQRSRDDLVKQRKWARRNGREAWRNRG